jgi:NAD(P)-dependent dehydrogenase (short-subunit alcohol dehydrogenase family)
VRAVDVRDARAVKSAVDAIAGTEGRIDHLVNNAGCTRDRALWNLSEEDWSEVLDVNLTGAFHVLQSVAHHMRARRSGRIVQIASINGMRGRFGQANYAASKAGLIGLTRTAARELGPSGITVNAVAPGMIETPMTERLPEAIRSRAVAETATGRLGLPADVVGAVLFLLSEQAAHVTGHVLVVDGGQLA